MGRGATLASSTIAADDFHRFIDDDKVAGVRSSMDNAPPPHYTTAAPDCSRLNFTLLTDDDVAAVRQVLNVIENCWNNMKKKVAAHRPTSERDLKDILRHVWVRPTEISPEYCKTLVHSMPSRINADINSHPTRY